jgi:DNA polymerase
LPKKGILEEIAQEISVCRKCPLWKTRKNAVPGDGPPSATLMFIGEAPGYWEDVKGKPFVGMAGKILDSLLAILGIPRSEIFIGNVLKCRPPQNRDPTPEEIRTCTPFLDRQIRALLPQCIVTLGRYSTGYIFSKMGLKFSSIGAVHGRFFEGQFLGLDVYIFPTYHPASALYSARNRKTLEEDFRTLRDELKWRDLLKF